MNTLRHAFDSRDHIDDTKRTASTRSNPTALDPSVEGAALQLSVLTSRTREEHDETHAMLRLRRPIVLAFRTRRTSHENRSSRHLAERMLELFPRDTTI